jgi:phage baseplate assembly protein W
MAMYNGFSTLTGSKKFRLTDFNLVKQDLQNHFNIRKGEKLMNPEFGTVIWDVIFEPLTDDTKNIIIQDIKKIVATDPRLAAQNVIITQYERGLQIELELVYLTTNQIDKLNLKFDQQNNRAAITL